MSAGGYKFFPKGNVPVQWNKSSAWNSLLSATPSPINFTGTQASTSCSLHLRYEYTLQWWISTVAFLHSWNRPCGTMLANTPAAGKLPARQSLPARVRLLPAALPGRLLLREQHKTSLKVSKKQQRTFKCLCTSRWDAKANLLTGSLHDTYVLTVK